MQLQHGSRAIDAVPSPFPGIPLVESPLYPLQRATMGLTAIEERIADDLHEHGFAVLDFPDPDFDERAERIKRALAPRFGLDPDAPVTSSMGVERRIQDGWRFDADVRAIAANPVMLGLLGKLYGRGAFPFQTLNFPVSTQQAAHTDAVHFSSLPERFMCGVWVALEDVGPGAGPLFYLPGSHRWPILSNALIGRRGHGSVLGSAQDPFGTGWDALISATGIQPQPFLARKGQALIWAANLLHGGSPQTDPDATRWSQVTHYYFDDCIYYTPAYSDEALGRLHLREPDDIVAGGRRANTYLGEPMMPNPAGGGRARPSLAKRLVRRLRG